VFVIVVAVAVSPRFQMDRLAAGAVVVVVMVVVVVITYHFFILCLYHDGI